MGDALAPFVGEPLPLIGINESVTSARTALDSTDALLVTDDGKPVGVITRHDVLAFVSA